MDNVKRSSDFELYSLAKNNIIASITGLDIFDWESDIIYKECQKRHQDIYRSAYDDAMMIIAIRQSKSEGVNVADIYSPSLMSRLELSNLLGSNGIDYVGGGNLAAESALKSLMSGIDSNYLLCKVSGDSMIDDGIIENDVLIVDRNPEIVEDKIIVASVNDILFVKRYKKDSGGEWLHSANAKYKAFKINDDVDFKIVGVVKMIIHSVE